jgi:hypothetical protein
MRAASGSATARESVEQALELGARVAVAVRRLVDEEELMDGGPLTETLAVLAVTQAQMVDAGSMPASKWRGWRTAIADPSFHDLRGPLRLRAGVERDWRPGLWKTSDISVTAEDAKPANRLKQLGAAVFGGSG